MCGMDGGTRFTWVKKDVRKLKNSYSIELKQMCMHPHMCLHNNKLSSFSNKLQTHIQEITNTLQEKENRKERHRKSKYKRHTKGQKEKPRSRSTNHEIQRKKYFGLSQQNNSRMCYFRWFEILLKERQKRVPRNF